jgi:hypothetical protein
MELITPEYSGRAWPAVASVGRVQKVIGLKASGKGKPFKAETAQAWWRNFAQIDVASETDVVGFVQRHGDPLDELGSTGFSDTSKWAEIQKPLKAAAEYWLPSRNHVSQTYALFPERRTKALNALAYSEWFKVRQEQAVVGSDFTFRAIAENLAAYMILSALINIKRNIHMTACRNCSDWFELQRQGSKFCTPSCRAIYSKSKKGAFDGND